MAMGFVIFPFAHILLSFLVLPKTISLHTSIFEIPNVVLVIEI